MSTMEKDVGVSVSKQVARMAVLVALSGVGAFIKIPSPTGTVALDSAPGYLGALAFGSKEGALIAALGHLLSAGTVGFPLSLPLHLFVAAQMALFAAVFGYLQRRVGMGTAVAASLNESCAGHLCPVARFRACVFWRHALALACSLDGQCGGGCPVVQSAEEDILRKGTEWVRR